MAKKRITAKQRAARKRNMAIARKSRWSSSGKKGKSKKSSKITFDKDGFQYKGGKATGARLDKANRKKGKGIQWDWKAYDRSMK